MALPTAIYTDDQIHVAQDRATICSLVDPRITRPHSPLPPQESVAVGASPLVENGAQRKLATILAADVVGYSRLTAADEEGTHARFKASLAEVIEPAIAKYQGRVIKNTGDGFLAEFASAVSCVACAVEIQRRLGRRNQDAVADRRMEFRFGINIGDVIADGGDVYGGGVNVAVRLEGMCDPGGILLSDDAYRQVHDKLEIEFQDRGPQNLKNIDTPVRAYAVEMGSVAGTAPVTSGAQHPQRMGLAIAAVVMAAVIGAIAWQATQPPTVEAAMVENMAFPLPEKPSIAVLAFDNLSSDTDQDFLGDGIAEDIITLLAKSDALFVISRNSTFTYKGQPVKVQRVAEELGVQYVLEGSIQRTGDEVRLTAQLIDALSGRHIWAERFDRPIDDIMSFRDAVVKQIVTALRVELVGGEFGRVEAQTNDPKAYELFLRSLQLTNLFTAPELREAQRLLGDALLLDPSYEEAAVQLGWVHGALAVFGYSLDPANEMERARDLAEQVLERNDRSASALFLQGTLGSGLITAIPR